MTFIAVAAVKDAGFRAAGRPSDASGRRAPRNRALPHRVPGGVLRKIEEDRHDRQVSRVPVDQRRDRWREPLGRVPGPCRPPRRPARREVAERVLEEKTVGAFRASPGEDRRQLRPVRKRPRKPLLLREAEDLEPAVGPAGHGAPGVGRRRTVGTLDPGL